MNDWSDLKFWLLGFMVFMYYPYMIWRNNFVFNYRTKVLFDPFRTRLENLERVARLPDYNVMVRQRLRFNWDDYLSD